jgi:hypothetical protein
MHKAECKNELDWTAFCYAAGELAPAEAAAFEERLAWMAVGSAASLLAASLLAAALVSGLIAPPGDIPLVEREDTGELAAAWSQTRQELSVASDAGLWFPDHLDAAADPPDPVAEEAALAATPSWLTAAVLSSAGLPVDGDATPFETPFDGQSLEN